MKLLLKVFKYNDLVFLLIQLFSDADYNKC
jgi:hypothetical protein